MRGRVYEVKMGSFLLENSRGWIEDGDFPAAPMMNTIILFGYLLDSWMKRGTCERANCLALSYSSSSLPTFFKINISSKIINLTG